MKKPNWLKNISNEDLKEIRSSDIISALYNDCLKFYEKEEDSKEEMNDENRE